MGWRDKLPGALFRRDGALTREQLLRPSAFGLGRLPGRLLPDATTNLICGYCSTGCSLTAHMRDGEAINLSPDPAYPVNLGMACPKGWEALAPLAAPDRGAAPLLRGPDGARREADWDGALAAFVDGFRGVMGRHGRGSVAFLSTGQIPTEEMLFLGLLAKSGMGFLHGDANTRQCMATAHVAYKTAFGFDAPPFTYADFEESDVLVFVGANPCIAHPILWERALRNRRDPRIIVVDPRRTETAMAATRHYAIVPKSDLVLAYALAHILFARGWVDRDFLDRHCAGRDGFEAHVRAFPPARAAAETGLAEAEICELAEAIRPGRRVSFWWTMGVNQSHEGVLLAQALINLALLGGHMGKPGTGANSITGQANAMGSRLFSHTSSLPGGGDFADAGGRRRVAEALGWDVNLITDAPGLPYDGIVDGIADGRIKGLWVIATNPFHSWIDLAALERAAANLEFLVVQDMYPDTETAHRAHLYLPAAGWGEKAGTFINSERRIGLLRPVRRPPGLALTDFEILRRVAAAWGCADLFREFTDPEAVFGILRRLSAGTPCDITGVTGYGMLAREGGVQWPWPGGSGAAPERERRLFADGRFFHPDGKARLLHGDPAPMPEVVTPEFPFLLLTGRGSSAQWHTNTRTGRSAVLRKLYPAECYLEIHPADAKALGLRAGQWVRVESRRGAVRARALPASAVARGQVFLPMHYAGVNRLTFPAFDPRSRQPAYKACAVRVVKSAGRWK